MRITPSLAGLALIFVSLALLALWVLVFGAAGMGIPFIFALGLFAVAVYHFLLEKKA